LGAHSDFRNFFSLLHRFDYKKEINSSNVLGTSGQLATSYARLMKHIWLGYSSIINPIQFKRKLEHFAPRFSGGHQQDAQELLAFLLDGIHEDLNRVVHKPYVEDVEGDGTNDEVNAMVAWERYLLRNKSVVVDVFQGQLRNTLVCSQCSHKSVKFDPFMYLSLPIDELHSHTLDDCLSLFCREEILTNDNQWYCPECKKHVDATKTFHLWTLPPILIVHLKRFKQNTVTGRFSKIDHGIDYPIRNWNLSHAVKCTSTYNKGEPLLYDLFAVTNHFGGFGSGHYTAYAMNRVDDQWYHFNDSYATLISEDLVGNNNNDAAYVLFYNRIIGISNNTATIPEDYEIPSEQQADHRRSMFSRVPVIFRQSLNRPEHWPQLQSEDVLRNYKRPVVASLYRRQSPYAHQSPNPYQADSEDSSANDSVSK
jgi:ubiquitin carboxyl-terminal hydrolase 8